MLSDNWSHSSVERVLHYATKLEQEAPHELPGKKPPKEWPTRGELVLNDVEMLALNGDISAPLLTATYATVIQPVLGVIVPVSQPY